MSNPTSRRTTKITKEKIERPKRCNYCGKTIKVGDETIVCYSGKEVRARFCSHQCYLDKSDENIMGGHESY